MTKILAVDDKPDNLTTLSAILKNYIPDCTVINALSGAQGIEKAISEQPDVILMDLKMPVMDGYEACEKIKANKSTYHIPVIMLTAIKTESADISHGLNSGADAFLSKPIDEVVLVAQVKTALRIKNAEDKLRNQKDLLEKMVRERTVALRKSEKNYRTLLESTSEGFWQLNPELKIIEVNPALCKMLGYSKEEMINKTPFDFADDENQKIFAEQISKISTTLHRSYEIVLRKKNHEPLPAHFNGTTIRDESGSLKSIFAFVSDITERKLAGQSVRASEIKYRQIFENIQDVYYETSIDGQIIELSPSIKNMFQYTRKELIGKSLYDFYSNPNERDRLVQTLIKKHLVTDYEITLKDKDGSLHNCSLVARLIQDDMGNPIKVVGSMHDITERKQAEESLRSVFEMNENIVNASPIGLSIYNSAGDCIAANDAIGKIVGASKDQILQQNFHQIESWKACGLYAVALSAMKEEQKKQHEIEITTTFGKSGNFACHLVPIKIGNKPHLLNTVEEITERKQAEASLRESEERFRTLFENAPLGYQSLDANGDIIAINETWCKLFGYTKEEVMGRNFSNFIHPDFEDVFKENFPKFKSMGYTLGTEFEMIKKDGTEVIIAFDGKIAYENDGSFKQTHCVLSDITERKLATERATLFSRMLDHSLNEIYIFDAETLRFIEVNRGALQNLGYSAEEMKDMTPLDLKPDVTAKEFSELTEPLRSGIEKKVLFTTNHRRKDGTLYPGEVHLQLIVDTTPVFVAIIIDITEKTKLQGQLYQAQKMESVGRLAGGVAHDYNNALSVIIGFTELSLDEVAPVGLMHDNLSEVLNAARRATDITRQLLAFARKQTIAPRVLDLNENVESMLKMLRRLIGEDLDLTWSPGAKIWPIKMDPSQIDQILANLCVNARDAIENVGRITITTSKTAFGASDCVNQIDIVPGEFVMLAVSDNGCGMEKEILDNIFEPFFTTKDVDKGTGLGMATVYGIVKQNNGFINVYSELGKGTTIKIYLPRHEGEDVEPHEEITAELPQGNGEVILVVEDDLSILKLARQILNRIGYTVLTAGTPAAAMSLIKEHSGEIHLLITDVIMPGMNGRELATRLQSSYPKLKCVFMSGYTADVIAHHGVLDEGVQFIQKPFSKSDLAITVRKSLDEQE